MRTITLVSMVASIALVGTVLIDGPAPAQAQASCGPAAYSVADQTYTSVPCTASAPKAEAGKAAPCGPVAYSVADQKYTGVPCAPEAPKAEAGKAAPGGPVAYSVADQKYTGVPCPH